MTNSMNDIHTHLYWQSYDTDRDAVVARARAAGVEKLLIIGCTVDESRQAIAVAEQYDNVYAAIGIHPQEFFDEAGPSAGGLNPESWIEQLRTLAQHEKVIAIGECGLEYYSHPARNATHNVAGGDSEKPITEEQKSWQKKGFLAQIALAQELHLPLILHCRTDQGKSDAYEDMFGILSDALKKANEAKQLPAVLHCYMGDTEVTRKFLTLPNVFFSFTGNITYPIKKVVAGTKDDLTETVKLIPLERIFTETDCPFLAPQSHRGERNEPAYVTEVAAKIAELHGTDTAAIERATEENFHKVFKI